MKKLLLALTLAGCSLNNSAEIIAKGQNPDLKCDGNGVIIRDIKIDVAVCTLKTKDGKTVDFLTATSSKHPFQAFPFKTQEQAEAQAEAEAKAKAAQPAAPAPSTPEAAPTAPKTAPSK